MDADYQQQMLLFKALAHPVRLQILNMLRQGETCVCHMEAIINKRQAYISQQLMSLRDANLIDSRREGRQVFYWIIDDTVHQLLDIALGPAKDQWDYLKDCPCPNCAVEFESDAHT